MFRIIRVFYKIRFGSVWIILSQVRFDFSVSDILLTPSVCIGDALREHGRQNVQLVE